VLDGVKSWRWIESLGKRASEIELKHRPLPGGEGERKTLIRSFAGSPREGESMEKLIIRNPEPKPLESFPLFRKMNACSS
jgi:hypothetical protein